MNHSTTNNAFIRRLQRGLKNVGNAGIRRPKKINLEELLSTRLHGIARNTRELEAALPYLQSIVAGERAAYLTRLRTIRAKLDAIEDALVAEVVS